MRFTLQRYILFCKDMPGMIAFYRDVMGLKLSTRTGVPETEWAELGGKAFRLCLHKSGKPGQAGRSRNKVVFSVDDVGVSRKHLIKGGARMGKHHHWGHLDACDGKDPEGNLFQIAGPPTDG